MCKTTLTRVLYNNGNNDNFYIYYLQIHTTARLALSDQMTQWLTGTTTGVNSLEQRRKKPSNGRMPLLSEQLKRVTNQYK